MQKPLVTIEKWVVVRSVISESFEELQPGNRLLGYVLGHPNLPHTKLVCTSPIQSVDFSQGGVVETLNTLYRLGEPSDDYKSWYYKRKSSTAA
jgi:hypothetical protein